ncbi:MAG: hypothetical protein CXZ00_01300 [Acidobacteria bacterium]|nr:MAG: hypothetical protein CXZ00_01300 [Acidobacteriota bacterium]
MSAATSKAVDTIESERRFYERYAWCLNPFQSMSQLFVRLEDELAWFPRLTSDWQRKESRTNLFLLTCAINCTVSDYLAPSLPSFAKLASQFRRARFAIKVLGKVSTSSFRLRSLLFDSAVYHWSEDWKQCVELSCEILLNEDEPNSPKVARLAALSRQLAGRALPKKLLTMRMQLPSGFRAQDLTHYDVLALAAAFARSHPVCDGTLAIIGARTAGAYFAALMRTRLQRDGWNSAWISIRPKGGVSWWERKFLRKTAKRAARVLVVDDYPDTGETIRLMIDLLGDYGVEHRNITVVVPGHEAQRSPQVLTGGYADVELVTISPQETYAHRLLAGHTLKPLLEQFLSRALRANLQFVDDQQTTAINQRLESHLQDDFQVHIKRVYAFKTPETGDNVRKVLVKGVGWGWLGYHAFLSGTRLQEFVPRVLGLRDGLLFSEWIEPPPGGSEIDSNAFSSRVAAYIAARVKLLPLAEHPSTDQPAFKAGGWYTAAKVLRGVYPPYLRLLKMNALWPALTAFATPQPTFIDGKLNAEEWLSDGKKLLKVDYEHHGFGNPSPNIVDAAYDLALATLQLNLSPEAQARLLDEYIGLTGDVNVRKRFVLHTIISGQLAKEYASFHSPRALSLESRKQLEAGHIRAHNFLFCSLSDFCSSEFVQSRPTHWSDRLFFMDLDGVFDRSYLFFPHATASGFAALESLNRQGYSVVLNTGRPAAHVRKYCSSYALSGGIAEYGCVFVDGINKRETVLIDEDSRERLACLRAQLSAAEDIFLDPTYEFAIRAYRLQNGKAVCLPQALVTEALRDFPQLTSFSSPVDTYIFPVSAGKGSSTEWVMEHFSVPRGATAAIGDSEMDIPMLDSVAKAYVPANASQAMIVQTRRNGCTILDTPFQRGLVDAVNCLLGESACSPSDLSSQPEHVVKTLLRIADRTAVQHLNAVLKPNRL